MGTGLLSALICLSPLLLVALGYAWGRYGLPIEIRRRKLADRRRKGSDQVEEMELETEIYTA